jgi:hypothetical protein
MSASMKKKGSRTQAAKKKAAKKKKENSMDKIKGRKKNATFAEPDKAGKKEDDKEVEACNRCIIGFAIRVDKGNNTKGGFVKKIAEGLAFLQEYLDKAACILPSRKDPRLGTIKLKADIPRYQVVMKNYFSTPNPMAFSNVTRDGGRVIKGPAIMGYSLDPKECLDNAAGDLQRMDCTLFYKKCQGVGTVSKLILLGVPNSIQQELIKLTLDKKLASLESTLLVTDIDYKLTKNQQENWIKYTVIEECPAGMP